MNKRTQLVAFGLTLFAILLLSSCASDGRTLAEPSGAQTTTTRSFTTSALGEEISDKSGFQLSSPEFSPAGEVPISATCDGGNNVPVLVWDNTPVDTQEIVVTLADYTDIENPLLLWLIGGIGPDSTGLDLPGNPGLTESLVQTQNDFGAEGFGTPCLESLGGDQPNAIRDLQFRVYALTGPSGLTQGAHGSDSWDDVKARSFDSAAILMRYLPGSTSDTLDLVEDTDVLDNPENPEQLELEDDTDSPELFAPLENTAEQ